ncbi:MAG: hypothetical protein NTX59_02115 [Elusimicrobia bacterium]|nr:hypothetical protein [Elusimicrobiota bacterium]
MNNKNAVVFSAGRDIYTPAGSQECYYATTLTGSSLNTKIILILAAAGKIYNHDLLRLGAAKNAALFLELA